jgi:tetratricopeptide (TPR) repeat protein
LVAIGHAARNDARACAAALGAADRAFGQARPGEGPAWLAYFDEAYLAARMAQCFRDLGEGQHAARFARRSLEMNQAYVRGRAFNLALLGTALAQQGQVEEACAAGTRAIEIAAGLRSRRSIRYVLDLRRRLTAYAAAPQVREFSERAGRLSAARAGHR